MTRKSPSRSGEKGKSARDIVRVVRFESRSSDQFSQEATVKAEWNRALGAPGEPYLRRWVLPIPFVGWSIRLHHWLSADDDDAFHDHPTWFRTLVLCGGYTDTSRGPGFDEKGRLVDAATALRRDAMRAGSCRYRPAVWGHMVLDVLPNTWTPCLFGREDRRWAFFWYDRDGGFRLRRLCRDKYFAEVGHHTPDGGRVRLRPDGSQIEAA